MITILTVATALILTCVWVHYRTLFFLNQRLGSLRVQPGLKMGVGLLGAIAAHVFEIVLFAVAYCSLARFERFGRIAGDLSHELRDYTYFSFTTYSTLGYGDLTPEGPLRILAGVESLMGLVLVTWTASFLFLEMRRHWQLVSSEE
jgi:hypothetical protein